MKVSDIKNLLKQYDEKKGWLKQSASKINKKFDIAKTKTATEQIHLLNEFLSTKKAQPEDDVQFSDFMAFCQEKGKRSLFTAKYLNSQSESAKIFKQWSENDARSTSLLLQMPNEILYLILQFLNKGELILFARVCTVTLTIAKEHPTLLKSAPLSTLTHSRFWQPKKKIEPVLLKGHTDKSTALISISDNQIASSSGNTIRIWDLKDRQCKLILTGHTDTVTTLQVSTDKQKIMSGGRDTTIRIWNIKTGVCEKVLEGHTGEINHLAVYPDKKTIISSDDQIIRLWNLEDNTSTIIHSEKEDWVKSLVVDRQRKKIIFSTGKASIYSKTINKVNIFDFSSAKIEKVISMEDLRQIHYIDQYFIHTLLPNGCILRYDDIDYKKIIIWDVLDELKIKKMLEPLQTKFAYTSRCTLINEDIAIIDGLDSRLHIWDKESNSFKQLLVARAQTFNKLLVTSRGDIVGTSTNGELLYWPAAEAPRTTVINTLKKVFS